MTTLSIKSAKTVLQKLKTYQLQNLPYTYSKYITWCFTPIQPQVTYWLYCKGHFAVGKSSVLWNNFSTLDAHISHFGLWFTWNRADDLRGCCFDRAGLGTPLWDSSDQWDRSWMPVPCRLSHWGRNNLWEIQHVRHLFVNWGQQA